MEPNITWQERRKPLFVSNNTISNVKELQVHLYDRSLRIYNYRSLFLLLKHRSFKLLCLSTRSWGEHLYSKYSGVKFRFSGLKKTITHDQSHFHLSWFCINLLEHYTISFQLAQRPTD